MEFAFIVDPVMLEFAVNVLTVIAFPTIVENVIILVDRLFVLNVDPVMLEFTVNVLMVTAFPSIDENVI